MRLTVDQTESLVDMLEKNGFNYMFDPYDGAPEYWHCGSRLYAVLNYDNFQFELYEDSTKKNRIFNTFDEKFINPEALEREIKPFIEARRKP